MDNTGFSIFMGLYTLILAALSILPIRMYKYDYLEEHPELKTPRERRQIPWEELIYEDRETLGPRKLRSFLFPWKDQ